jgi:hypothetical protein
VEYWHRRSRSHLFRRQQQSLCIYPAYRDANANANTHTDAYTNTNAHSYAFSNTNSYADSSTHTASTFLTDCNSECVPGNHAELD